MLYYPDVTEKYMIEAREPKHIGSIMPGVLQVIEQKHRACLEPQGRDILQKLREQIRIRKLYLKHETSDFSSMV